MNFTLLKIFINHNMVGTNNKENLTKSGTFTLCLSSLFNNNSMVNNKNDVLFI